MSYRIVWEPSALAVAEKHAAGDREGIQQVFRAVDLLADNPRPSGAYTVGATGIYRIQVGFYRVHYEIDDLTVTVTVFHLGRV
ncbi:mRNA interferase RelE/StbE [Kitasatospora sp. MAA4]|uniref:type II toxin-antitoxin system RelE family toxin n=1 Tax=Kitasatospora sp. MAA4 TaxID=3035093 RepID=UPI00247574C6|nr:type II toxin-antitoxin system RelE/ParE family toxin [Kitasatospora sp. MAA4]MDH6136487.1 mRNA interferase RelE/StbE [Kitasatospora sp. MAA4]